MYVLLFVGLLRGKPYKVVLCYCGNFITHNPAHPKFLNSRTVEKAAYVLSKANDFLQYNIDASGKPEQLSPRILLATHHQNNATKRLLATSRKNPDLPQQYANTMSDTSKTLTVPSWQFLAVIISNQKLALQLTSK